MSTVLLASLLLCPPFFIVIHTLVGILLMSVYGVDKWRWRAGAIEVMAGKKADGTTRIWFKPGAQTWGLVIFCADGRNFESESLHVHERVHILQTYLFGVFYLLTYALAFGALFAIVKAKLDWWERNAQDDDVWHAYRKIPWEIWAYAKQGRFERGEFQGTWGSFQ